VRLAVVESAPRGGLLQYAAQLADALAGRGHSVELVTARGHELEAPLERARVCDVLVAAVSNPGETPTGVRYQLRRAGIAIRLVRASARTLWEVRRWGYDAALLVDDLSVSPAAAGALALTFVPGRPLLAAVCHEPRPRSRRPGPDLYATSPLLLGLLRRLYPRLDVVFVHGERSRAEFVRTWPPSHVYIIPHGDERLLAGDPPPAADEERVLFFGEWRRAKGLWELLHAFDLVAERRPGARLTIAGTPTPDVDPGAVRRWAAERAERVEVIDRYLSMSEARAAFAAARVVATPYLAGSQSGVVHLAMTMARAVIASDVGELPTTVMDGATGRIVPAGDVTALANALHEVLGDPVLAHEWGEAGRAHLQAVASWELVAERVELALAAAGASI
jgi:glycosyltransferase involved in cell wall biosynthesis